MGNDYLEAQTRNAGRTDVVVDYRGEQSIVEMRIWRGNEYNERGKAQLGDYLDYFHRKKGYMLSLNFNKKKVPGVKVITVWNCRTQGDSRGRQFYNLALKKSTLEDDIDNKVE